MKLSTKVMGWYEGKMAPYENDRSSGVLFVSWTYDRHWTAKFVRILVEFYLANWQWLIGTLIGALSLWVAVLALK